MPKHFSSAAFYTVIVTIGGGGGGDVGTHWSSEMYPGDGQISS